MKTLILLFTLLSIPFLIEAQSARKLLLEGDFHMGMNNFEEAEKNYQAATSKKASFKSFYNTGVAQESQIPTNKQSTAGMMMAMEEPQEDPNEAEAIRSYTSAIELAENNEQKSRALYNKANAILKNTQTLNREKLEEAISTYKDAIVKDRSNDRAKHNLAVAQIQLDQAKQQEQQQQQQQDQEQQEQQDQEQQEQQQQEQEQQEQQEQEQQEQKEQEQQQNQEAEQREEQESKEKASKAEMEKILEMVEKEDQEVQQKMRATSKTNAKEKKKKW